MPPVADFSTSDSARIDTLFAYQQTKRLHLLIDQLLWSFEQAAGHAMPALWNAYLHEMAHEAKAHLLQLDRKPVAAAQL